MSIIVLFPFILFLFFTQRLLGQRKKRKKEGRVHGGDLRDTSKSRYLKGEKRWRGRGLEDTKGGDFRIKEGGCRPLFQGVSSALFGRQEPRARRQDDSICLALH